MTRPFVLVAAFRPFGGRTENESGEALAAFRRSLRPSDAVRTVVLPVSWTRAFPRLVALLDRPGLAAVVLFGEAGKRRGVTVERWGRNLSKPIPDVSGARPATKRLARSGALRRKATWAPRAVAAIARGVGVPAGESRDAGGFLCNAVLYLTLEHLARRGDRVPVTFVHFPIPGAGAAPSITRRRLAKVLAAVVGEATRRFVATTPAPRPRAPRRAPRPA